MVSTIFNIIVFVVMFIFISKKDEEIVDLRNEVAYLKKLRYDDVDKMRKLRDDLKRSDRNLKKAGKILQSAKMED